MDQRKLFTENIDRHHQSDGRTNILQKAECAEAHLFCRGRKQNERHRRDRTAQNQQNIRIRIFIQKRSLTIGLPIDDKEQAEGKQQHRFHEYAIQPTDIGGLAEVSVKRKRQAQGQRNEGKCA